MDNFVEYSDESIFFLSLDLFRYSLCQVTENSFYWKWVIVGLHSSVYDALILALRGTNLQRLIRKDQVTKWRSCLENGDQAEEWKTESFLDLYEKIKGSEMDMYINSSRFVPNKTQDNHFIELNQLRNSFLHSKPVYWMIEIPFLISIVKDCFPILDFLVNKSGNIFWNDLHAQDRYNFYYDEIITLIDAL